MNDITQQHLQEAEEALNAILKRAQLNHMRAFVTALGDDRVLRIIYNTHPADPRADLTGDDCLRLCQAFQLSGIPAGEYAAQTSGKNSPALHAVFNTPPQGMENIIKLGYMNPWTMYVLRPDASCLRTHEEELVAHLRARFASNEQQAASRPAVV